MAYFSPAALNWVALLPSKLYLPGNMQVLVGQVRNPKERKGGTTQVYPPLTRRDATQLWILYLTFYPGIFTTIF